MPRLSLVILALLLLFQPAFGLSLDGRLVVLVVGEHREKDPELTALEGFLVRQRGEIGLDTESMPIVLMGFRDSDNERGYFSRLGFKELDAPVVCVVRWGSPQRFGPKEVVGGHILRGAHAEDTAELNRILAGYLELTNQGHLASKLSGGGRIPIGPSTSDVLIEDSRFEANGSPIFMVNSRIRIKNTGSDALNDIRFRFYYRLGQGGEWRLLGEQSVQRLPGGYVCSRDVVVDSRKLGLLDQDQHVRPCDFRIEVHFSGRVRSVEGRFVPREL